MSRKTFEVKTVQDEINTKLASDIPQEAKKELCVVLENILFKTGNYHGHNYIYWLDKGFNLWIEAGEPGFPEKELYITNNKKEEFSRYYY